MLFFNNLNNTPGKRKEEEAFAPADQPLPHADVKAERKQIMQSGGMFSEREEKGVLGFVSASKGQTTGSSLQGVAAQATTYQASYSVSVTVASTTILGSQGGAQGAQLAMRPGTEPAAVAAPSAIPVVHCMISTKQTGLDVTSSKQMGAVHAAPAVPQVELGGASAPLTRGDVAQNLSIRGIVPAIKDPGDGTSPIPQHLPHHVIRHARPAHDNDKRNQVEPAHHNTPEPKAQDSRPTMRAAPVSEVLETSQKTAPTIDANPKNRDTSQREPAPPKTPSQEKDSPMPKPAEAAPTDLGKPERPLPDRAPGGPPSKEAEPTSNKPTESVAVEVTKIVRSIQDPTREQTPLKDRDTPTVKDPEITQPRERRPELPSSDKRNDLERLLPEIGREISPRPLPGIITDTTNSPTLPTPLQEIQIRLQDRLSQIRDAISTIAERAPLPAPQHSNTSTETPAIRTQSAGDFQRFDVPRLITPAPQAAVLQERGSPTGQPLPTMVAGRVPAVSIGLAPVNVDLPTVQSQVKQMLDAESRLTRPLSALLDAISNSISTSRPVEVLKKMEQAFETATTSVAAAVALGVIGTEMAVKEVVSLGKALVKRLRESESLTGIPDPQALTIEGLVAEIEGKQSLDEVKVDTVATSFVADITGIILSSSSGAPLQGVTVNGGSLGSVDTDQFGVFAFHGVPQNLPFVLTPMKSGYTFAPGAIIGTVSLTNHYTIYGSETA